MKQKFTKTLRLCFCLLFILLVKQAHAQEPKILNGYPFLPQDGSKINALIRKDNTLIIGGELRGLTTNPVNYGLSYNVIGNQGPNGSWVNPDNLVNFSLADDSGGFYIFGTFANVGGVARSGMARINADGTLNEWAPHDISGSLNVVGDVAVKAGNTLILAGSFTAIGSQTYQQGQLVALDATTGEPLSGWGDLAIPNIGSGTIISRVILNDNKLYILGNETARGGRITLAVIDISNPSSPSVLNSFQLDAISNSDAKLPLIDIVASGNTIYVSAWDADHSYQNKTLSGQAFNSTLFAVDGTTGAFIKSFATPLEATDVIGSTAIDGNTLYMSYHTGATGKLAAFDLTTGDDISSTLPSITTSAAAEPTIPFTLNVPIFNINKLIVTADHHLIIFNSVLDQVNGQSRKLAVLNLLPGGGVVDWDPILNNLPSTVAESNGKIYLGGDLFYQLSGIYNSLTAIDLQTQGVLSIPDLGFTPNGPNGLFPEIYALAIHNNTLYVGGAFSLAGGIQHLAAFDISDINNPVLKADWMPNPDLSVKTLVVNGDKLYVGGDFTQLDGQAKTRLAEFDLSSGTGVLNSSWTPEPDRTVKTLLVQNGVLYAGGDFESIGADARKFVAAFDLSNSNSLTSWDASITGFGTVSALVSQAGDGNHDARIFIGGTFNTVGSTTVNGLAAVNTTDGAPDPWQLTTGLATNVISLAVAQNKLYAGGQDQFKSINISGNTATVDATDYLDIANGTTGQVQTLLAMDDLLAAGGDFIGNTIPRGLAIFRVGNPKAAITFADITKTYGDTDSPLTATSNQSATPVTYALSEQKDVNGTDATIAEITTDGKLKVLMPGTAKITASQAGNTDYEAAIDVIVNLTINKAELSVHPKDAEKVVNQPIQNLPFILTGWKFDDETKTDIFSGQPEFTTTATATSPVGTYTISVSGAGTLTSNYYTFAPVTSETANLSVTATGSTPQMITFQPIADHIYGDADITLTGTTDASGLSVQYASSDPAIATITNNKLHIEGAGTVTIIASQSGNASYAPATDVPQTLNIAKASLTIKADDKIKDRGTVNPEFTATFTGFVNGDKVNNLTTVTAFSTTALTNAAPGDYPIVVSNATSSNYAITFVNGTLTVRGTQLITWAPLSTLTYGDAPFNPGAVSDAGVSFAPIYTTDNPLVIAINNGQAVIKGAGTAMLTATFSAGNGFELTTSKLQVTILKKQLNITADDKTRGFGQANPVFTYTYNGFVTGDTFNTPGVLTKQATASTDATDTSPIGDYSINVSGATSNNYTITFIPGILNVISLTRTLTFSTIPAKTYGNPDFDGASLNSSEQVVYAFSNPSVATMVNGKIHITGAGTTDITASAPTNNNYNTVTPITQTLVVSKAPLIISADSKSKTQGPPDIALTASYSGFVNSDNQLNLVARPVLTTKATTNSPAGTYSITASGASSPNYDIAYQSGTLTIILAIGQEDVIVDQALSPNGDGLNDYFKINGITNFPDNHVAIINRNGQKVYEVNGYDNATRAFTGKSSQDGNVLQQGTYFYRIEYKLNGQQVRKSGYLVLKY